MDGDFVTVKTSRGTDGELSVILTLAPEGLGMELREIDFSANAAVFFGTDFAVTAKRTSAGGDGHVNVGYIDATAADDGASLNVGNVRIGGDLGRINAGTASASVAAVKSLTVQSMGEFGTSTQGASASLESSLIGALGKLAVAGNIREASVFVLGAGIGRIGSVTIGGSLIGGGTNQSGFIFSDTAMGPVKIGGNIEGGSGTLSGRIETGGNLATVTFGGSLLGGSGQTSGSISADFMGLVKIGGDLRGGSATNSGFISATDIAGVTIGGSLVGGSGSVSGRISVNDALGPVKIGGNIQGGSVSTATASGFAGSIQAGSLTSLTVGGSIIAGTETGGGSLDNSGAVRVSGPIGAIVVKGSLVGNATQRVLITALGQPTSTATSDVAIKSLTVVGRVESADILAGYNNNSTPSGVNADAQIGAVVVGDWIASSLVAGAQDDATVGFDSFFGDADDVKITDPNDAPNVVSKIASIRIKGTARGTIGGSDHYGFVAQQIGSFKIGVATFRLVAGAASTLDITGYAIGITGDLRLREVAL